MIAETVARNYRDWWRIGTAALVRRFGIAAADDIENAVQTAFTRAIDAWPHQGVPDDPVAWIIRAAHNALVDEYRRAKTQARTTDALVATRAAETTAPEPLDDDVLRLVLICCHPALGWRDSVALTLRTVFGVDMRAVAAALHMGEDAARRQLTRARRRVRDLSLPFALPEDDDLVDRLDRVLDILYLVFGEGYSAHWGPALVRKDLCQEAFRVTRILLTVRLPDPGPVYALAALFAFQASRLDARIAADGTPVSLERQDRGAWDRQGIAFGFQCLERSMRGRRNTSYHLQAAIAACHAMAACHADTDWQRICGLYDRLRVIEPSPVVDLNRAVAVMMVHGPAAGLAVLRPLEASDALRGNHRLPTLIADFLVRAGRDAEARPYYRRALNLVQTPPERRHLADRLRALEAV